MSRSRMLTVVRSAWWRSVAHRVPHLLHRTTVVALVSGIYSVMLIWSTMTLLIPSQVTVALAALPPDKVQVAAVAPGGLLWNQGIRPGDAVLTLDGQPPTVPIGRVWTGGQIEVHTLTGQTILVDANTRQIFATWPLVVLSPWFLLLGTLVFVRAPHPRIARSTYALLGSAAFALALAPLSLGEHMFAVIAEWVAVPLFGACFVWFCLTFPTTREGRHWRLAVLLALGGVIVLSFLPMRYPAVYELASLGRMLILLGYLLLGLSVLTYSFLTTQDQVTRRGLASINCGTLASLLPFIVLYLLPTLLGRSPIMSAELAILPLGFFPASLVYAILRHQVLNVSLLQRWLVQACVWSILLGSYGAGVYGIEWLLRNLPAPEHDLVLAVLFVVLIGVSFSWLRIWLRRSIDRVVFKDSYEYRHALSALSNDLSSATTLATLSMSLPSTLRRLMNLDFALILVRDPQGTSAVGSAGAYDSAMLPDLVTAANDVQMVPQIVPLGYGYIKVLFVPLRTQDVVVGHICLGPKANGEPFRAEDKDLLTTLSGHVAGIVHNAQLVAALSVQVQELDVLNARLHRAQEDERARLSADIHDEPLQTAISLQRELASLPADQRGSASLIGISQLLITQLRSVCVQIRPTALDDLGLFAALDQLTQEQSERFSVPIRLDVDPVLIECDLSSAQMTVLYRAVQEALTNSLRHAQPRHIDVCLAQHTNWVNLQVTDDGTGFSVPQRLEHLVMEGHLGLAGLRERVQYSGGSLYVTSTPGQGTRVQVDLPLRVEAAV